MNVLLVDFYKFRTVNVVICEKASHNLSFQNIIGEDLRFEFLLLLGGLFIRISIRRVGNFFLFQDIHIPDVELANPYCVTQCLLLLDKCPCLREMLFFQFELSHLGL